MSIANALRDPEPVEACRSDIGRAILAERYDYIAQHMRSAAACRLDVHQLNPTLCRPIWLSTNAFLR